MTSPYAAAQRPRARAAAQARGEEQERPGQQLVSSSKAYKPLPTSRPKPQYSSDEEDECPLTPNRPHPSNASYAPAQASMHAPSIKPKASRNIYALQSPAAAAAEEQGGALTRRRKAASETNHRFDAGGRASAEAFRLPLLPSIHGNTASNTSNTNNNTIPASSPFAAHAGMTQPSPIKPMPTSPELRAMSVPQAIAVTNSGVFSLATPAWATRSSEPGPGFGEAAAAAGAELSGGRRTPGARHAWAVDEEDEELWGGGDEMDDRLSCPQPLRSRGAGAGGPLLPQGGRPLRASLQRHLSLRSPRPTPQESASAFASAAADGFSHGAPPSLHPESSDSALLHCQAQLPGSQSAIFKMRASEPGTALGQRTWRNWEEDEEEDEEDESVEGVGHRIAAGRDGRGVVAHAALDGELEARRDLVPAFEDCSRRESLDSLKEEEQQGEDDAPRFLEAEASKSYEEDLNYVTEEELQYIMARLNKAAADKQAPSNSSSAAASGGGGRAVKPSNATKPLPRVSVSGPAAPPTSRAVSRQTSLSSQQGGTPAKPPAAPAAAPTSVSPGQAARPPQPPALQREGSYQRQTAQLQRHTSLPAPPPGGQGVGKGTGGRRVQFTASRQASGAIKDGLSSSASSSSLGGQQNPGLPKASPSKPLPGAQKTWQGPKPITMPPRLPARAFTKIIDPLDIATLALERYEESTQERSAPPTRPTLQRAASHEPSRMSSYVTASYVPTLPSHAAPASPFGDHPYAPLTSTPLAPSTPAGQAPDHALALASPVSSSGNASAHALGHAYSSPFSNA